MEQKIKEIIRQIGDLGEKVSRLLALQNIPAIEIDIILGDIRVLYENIRELQSGTRGTGKEVRSPADSRSGEGLPEHASGTPAGERKTVPGGTETPPGEPAGRTGGMETPAGKTTGTGASGEESRSAAPGREGQVSREKTGTSGKTDRKGSSSGPSGRAILADKYKSGQTFINESLAGDRRNQDVGSKIQSKPIRNIGSALGINDRFKLINELFNGDKDSFQNTIGILDGAANFNEAFNYINSSFDWDMEEDSVQLLLDLVRRKFIINQNE